jgi:hypothetical protein
MVDPAEWPEPGREALVQEGLTDLVLVRTPTGGLARPDDPATVLTVQQLVEPVDRASGAVADWC